MRRYILDARTATDHFPGIGRYVSNLSRALVPLLEPSEELLLLVAEGVQSRWPLPGRKQGVRRIRVTASPFSLQQQWQLPALLKEHRASVYHSPYYLMPYCVPAPTVLTIHDLIPELFPEYVSVQARLLFRLTTRLALQAAGHLITVSDTTKGDLLSRYAVPEEQVTTIHSAPDSTLQPASQREVDDLRARLALPERYVLYLGINKPHKNLARLLEAWHIVCQQLSEEAPGTLVIAGAWDSRYEQIRDLSEQDAGVAPVRFLGPVDEADLAALYSGATLFVFPSLYEGFGLPVLEAMACGTAVVCARRSSLPEIAGDAAFFFNPEDVQEMADALWRVLNDARLRGSLQQRARQRAAAFSWEATARKTLNCYRTLPASERAH
jgi:alpha-1,3-rhamnosyl/mannosyltransferase